MREEGVAGGLDHVGIVGADFTDMAAVFERLGFTLTRLARHEGKATGNRCIMLRAGYLELFAVIDPAGKSATVAAMLARYAGAHIVALSVADAAAALQRTSRAGLAIPAVVDGRRDAVRYATLPLTDAPEGRLLLIEHRTPEALRPANVLGHANRAVSLDEVVIATDTPAAAASRCSRLTGLPVQPDPLGGFVLRMEQGRVRLLPPDAVRVLFPEAEPPALPWIAGVALGTDDRNAALRRRLGYWGIEHQTAGERIVVAACGAFLSFAGR